MKLKGKFIIRVKTEVFKRRKWKDFRNKSNNLVFAILKKYNETVILSEMFALNIPLYHRVEFWTAGKDTVKSTM